MTIPVWTECDQSVGAVILLGPWMPMGIQMGGSAFTECTATATVMTECSAVAPPYTEKSKAQPPWTEGTV